MNERKKVLSRPVLISFRAENRLTHARLHEERKEWKKVRGKGWKFQHSEPRITFCLERRQKRGKRREREDTSVSWKSRRTGRDEVEDPRLGKGLNSRFLSRSVCFSQMAFCSYFQIQTAAGIGLKNQSGSLFLMITGGSGGSRNGNCCYPGLCLSSLSLFPRQSHSKFWCTSLDSSPAQL